MLSYVVSYVLCGKVVPRCGILVVRDPPGVFSSAPGILGMNVIRRCYAELFDALGSSLFEAPAVVKAPQSVVVVLQKCHEASPEKDLVTSTVKV